MGGDGTLERLGWSGGRVGERMLRGGGAEGLSCGGRQGRGRVKGAECPGWKGTGSGVGPYRLDTMAGTSVSSTGEADRLSLSSSSTVKEEGRGAREGAWRWRGMPLGPAGHTAAACW